MTAAPVVPTGPSPDATGASGTAKTAGLAIASLVAGILGLCTAGLGGIAGLILGIIALKKIGRSGGALRGRGLAIAGLIVSVCTLLLWVLAAVVVGVLPMLILLGPSSKEVEKGRSPVKTAAAPAAEQLEPVVPTAAAPAELALDLGGGVTLKLVLIPAGKFLMGEGQGRHEVTLSKPFYMGVTDVTQAQYEAVIGANPSYFKGPTNPVEQVSWNDATEFCKKLSEKTRRAVRLPTEAEWEYACRAGAKTHFCFGDADEGLGDYAWYSANSEQKTYPVGQKKPNAWGLYDVHGNVWQWCADWYGDYPKGAMTDPQGAASGSQRVLRGGSWGSTPDSCRAAFRYRSIPGSRNLDYFGFRVVVSLAGVDLK